MAKSELTSPWPILTALSAGVLAIGAVMFIHGKGWLLMAFGGVSIVAMIAFWIVEVAREEAPQESSTRRGFEYGMLLFITSEVMFFFAFFWAFFNASLFPAQVLNGKWPPASIKPIEIFDVPVILTLVLLLSGVTVTWAHYALLGNKIKDAIRALAVTIALGVSFVCFQAYEYAKAGFGLKEGIYPSLFFTTTGFHGLHVIIGIAFLSAVLFRVNKGQLTSHSHFGFTAAAWYWHFVDTVWLFLFALVYVWGGGAL